jgi:hypothetical protein
MPSAISEDFRGAIALLKGGKKLHCGSEESRVQMPDGGDCRRTFNKLAHGLSNAGLFGMLNDGHPETDCSGLLMESGAVCIEQNREG